MRELVIKTILDLAKSGNDEYTRGIGMSKRWRLLDRWNEDVERGLLSLEVYLRRLTDQELLDAFEGQQCKKYR